MRVGIFSESYAPVVNGVTVSILTLTRELKKMGHEVTVFAPKYPGHTDVENECIRFPSIRPPGVADYPLAIPCIPGLKRKVRDLRLDIIHTHTPFTLGWLGLRLGRSLGIPVISTNHTYYVEYAHYFPLAPQNVTRSFLVGMMRRYYNRCGGVIVPSTPFSDLLKSYGITRPIYVIPTGNSLETSSDPAAKARIRSEFGVPAEAMVLIYVGRLAREKNLDLLFDVFARVAKKYPDVWLMMVGDGPSLPECRQMARKTGVEERIVFTGRIPREAVAPYYSAGDIFAFPSVTETQGLVLGEALQAGLPCVAVNAGGSAEMLRDGEDSLLCSNDLADFGGNIERLLTDPQLMDRLSGNAARSAERFSPRAMGRSVVEAYRSVIEASRPSPTP